MTHPQVAIVVINWKLKETTLECIRSVERSGTPCRVLVVDNGSGDGSVEYFAEHAPDAEIIALPKNVGFGRACNIAIRRVLIDPTSEYILLLNNDAIIEPETLPALLAAAAAAPQVGIFGPKIYYHDRPDTFWYAGSRRRRWVFAAADTGRGQRDTGQFEQRCEVDYIFGAAMLIRRQVFETVGMFDEQFFLYLEDLDLCLMTQRSGFPLHFVPQARVWHSVSASTHDHLGIRRYHMVRSTILFLKKHTTAWTFTPTLLFWPLVGLHFLLNDVLAGHVGVMRLYFSGLFHGMLPAKPDQSGGDNLKTSQITSD
ncbi:MAG: glycosyltransferase family 2 protein [Comamonadaceae bacterium]